MEGQLSETDSKSERRVSAGVMFVDLDGTLLKGDLVHEALFAAMKSSPWLVLTSVLSLRRGRAAFKRALTLPVKLDVGHLPFREEVLDLICSVRSKDYRVVLATAADVTWAQQIASELGLFDDVLASDGLRNLKGRAKLDAIRDYCHRHGFGKFDYVGDSYADWPIWAEAQRAYAASPSFWLKATLRRRAESLTILGRPKRLWVELLKSMRVHQWSKNLLVFVPLVTSHRVLELPLLIAAIASFMCFCLCASAVYAINDLVDIQSDRRHPVKRLRPFASGELPTIYGLILGLLLAVGGLAISAFALPPSFTILLALYIAITSAYSLWIKRVVMLDVVTLACLYALRVLGGGLGTSIPVSPWLMAFSLFIFLSLAFAKRYSELARMEVTNEKATNGRGYHVSDLSLIESMGPACGFLAVLVLALYIQSDQMKQLYSGSWALWLLCPLLAYWIGRIWFLAKRQILGEDPVVFAIRDPISLLLAVIALGLLVAGAA